MEFLIALVILFGLFGAWGTWLNKKKERAQRIRVAEFISFGWHAQITPIEFEQRCAEALRVAGWHAETTKASGDQGIDVYARRGTVSVVFQCKLYSHPVGNDAVQEAYAGSRHRDANFAGVITNSTYTRSAIELSETTGVRLLHFRDLRHVNQLFGFPDVPLPNLENELQSRSRSISDFVQGLTDVRFGEPLYPSFRARHRLRLKEAMASSDLSQGKMKRADLVRQLGLVPEEHKRLTVRRAFRIGGQVVACGIGFIIVFGLIGAIVGPPPKRAAHQVAAEIPIAPIATSLTTSPGQSVETSSERIVATIINGRQRVEAQAEPPRRSVGFEAISSKHR